MALYPRIEIYKLIFVEGEKLGSPEKQPESTGENQQATL